MSSQAARGRPAKPTQHPLGSRLRTRRTERGLTVRDLARLSGLRESSASYISQLESGAKTPHEPLARRLAEALDDDPRLYLAWAALGRRSDPLATARAVRLLGDLLPHHPAFASMREPGAGEGSAARTAPPRSHDTEVAPLAGPVPGVWHPPALPAAAGEPATDPGSDRLVPEYEEGADPGDPPRAAPRVLATHRLPAAALEPLFRPFAYRLSETGVRRVRDVLRPSGIALLTRRTWPLELCAPYAVRLSGHAVLSRVLWNERQLLLLPAPGDSDFLVLEAIGRTALERLLAGRVAALLRPGDPAPA